ncbi:NHL repeat-containing protein [candidate division KSB1 bacterium]
MKYSIAAILLVMVIFAAACSRDQSTYTVEVIDGVRHVHNHAPLWGGEPRITLEFVQKIGELEGHDENYLLFRPTSLDVDSEGNIYIVETGENAVKKFDRSGTFVQTFGTEGQGPGELNWPLDIFIDSDDRIYVQNAGNRRIEIFEQDGRYVDSWRIQIMNEKIAMMSGGSFAVLPRQRFLSPDQDQGLISIKDTTGAILRSFGAVKDYQNPDMADGGNGGEIVVDSANNIYIAMLNQNRIEKYTPDGRLLMKISRDLPYEESEIVFDPGTQERVDNIFAQGLEIDAQGRMWADTYERQFTSEEKALEDNTRKPNLTVLEIYDKDGILLTRVKTGLPNGYRLCRISGGRAYFVESRDYMDVQVFRIVEPK